MKLKPNTIWDYAVPLSLVGLVILVYNYGSINYEVYDTNKGEHFLVKDPDRINDLSSFEGAFSVFLIFATVFFTRTQRLLFPPGLILIYWIIARILYNLHKPIDILPFINIVVFISILTIPYFLAVLSLLVKFGNNSTEKISKKSTPIRSAIAFGIYGFGLNILPLFTRGGEFLFGEIFDFLDPILQLSAFLYISFYFFLFALIGFIVEKYKQRKG